MPILGEQKTAEFNLPLKYYLLFFIAFIMMLVIASHSAWLIDVDDAIVEDISFLLSSKVFASE
jgi:hypothetical protein